MVTGGYYNLDSTELYDPSTGHWRMSGPLPHAYYGLRAATVDNRVLVFGETIDKKIIPLSYLKPRYVHRGSGEHCSGV